MEPPQMETAEILANRHILVVEDEYFLAFDLAKKLGASGAIVLGPAPSISQATSILSQSTRPDAALLDVNVQDILVYPIADTLIERGVPFLFTTGYDKQAVPGKYRDIPRLPKPYEFSDILDQLNKFFS